MQLSLSLMRKEREHANGGSGGGGDGGEKVERAVAAISPLSLFLSRETTPLKGGEEGKVDFLLPSLFNLGERGGVSIIWWNSKACQDIRINR